MSDFQPKQYLLVHYGEIGLKGANRSRFIDALRQNILQKLSGLDVRPDRKRSGRLVFRLGPSVRWEEVARRLRSVFGVAYFSRAWSVPLKMEALEEAVLAHLPRKSGISFAVRTRRANKQFPLTSMDIDRRLGAAIRQATDWHVDLTHPDLTVEVEVVFQEMFFYFDRVTGARGMPVGTSGTVVNLLSGGIDSPVAAWYMLKRGCRVVNVHFHGAPLTSRASEVKAIELARILTGWGGSPTLYSIPIGQIQAEIMRTSPPDYRVVLYRRLMVRVAQEIARREGAAALSTGESLAQVASQTLRNLRAIEQVAELPILRPLIGMDKEEIVARAEQIETLAISNLSGEDCCTLFIPKHPVTGAKLERIAEIEARQPWNEWVDKALSGATVIDVHASPVDILQHYPELLERLA
ncbi:MAG: tRNA 4-thiouridine(8) synthase ThiI [Chloroflexi bacterium]|nr:MAG: tRNA 4-thiouridine(8) synthase ThiI [Chloroflexota bacterium]